MNDFQRKKTEESQEVKPSAYVLQRAFGPGRLTPMGELLGPNGPLAKLPTYQERVGQIGLADAIYQGLCEKKHVIAEAGTGTGKSFSALIPAIKRTTDQGGADLNHRILVSTAMLILQDQYTAKDLPFLTEHLGIKFSWCVRKGRGNYACDNRIERARNGELQVAREDQAMFEMVCEWSAETKTGDTAELPFELNKYPKLKGKVTANSDNCRGQECDFLQMNQCHYFESKKKAEKCEIIVVNHALLVLNYVFWGMILPEYDAIIIDEAHKLEDVVRNALQASLTPRNFLGILRGIRDLNVFAEEKLEQFEEEIRNAIESIEEELSRILPKPGTCRFEIEQVTDGFHVHMDRLKEIFRIFYVAVREVASRETDPNVLADKEKSQASRVLLRIEALGMGLVSFTANSSNSVVWVEREARPDKPDKITLSSAPISIAGYMKATLLEKPCIFLSATLATGYGEEAFTTLKERLGIERAIELQMDSPFDYLRNTRYCLAKYPGGLDKPPSDKDEWADYITPRLKALLEVTDAGALLLFTSWRVCSEVFFRLQYDKPRHWSIYCQGEMSKSETIKAFKESPHSILCATSSFFEGVDIPGLGLRMVAIDKIPFPMVSDPIQSAISDTYGKQWFKKHHIPYAIIHMKQGVGRAIRRETDRALLALMDPRFRTKNYGAQILDALPGYTHGSKFSEIKEFVKGILNDLNT